MKKLISFALCFTVLTVVVFSQVARAEEKLTANQIMQRVDERTGPEDLTSRTIMNLIDKKGNVRERILKNYRMGEDKWILWFLQPPNVKGSSFLRIAHEDRDDDMWIYLPAFGKVRRIAAHAKKGNFMGSDFTYEDLGERKLKDYKYRLLKEDTMDKKSCWVIESIPQKDVITDYSKIVSWVWKEEYIVIKEEYYDIKGRLKKIKTVDLTKVEGYWLPESLIMENLKTKHKTEMINKEIDCDVGLKEEMFESHYMTRIH